LNFGITIPNNWGIEDPQDVFNVAVLAEEMGYDSIWVNHHVFNAGYVKERLGQLPYYDALTTLTYAAALTKRVRLGTTVLVLPYLNPMVLAKTLATLDVFSGGRLIAGVGVGALRHESDSLGSDYHTRGAYANESIAIMKELWTNDEPNFEGRFFSFSGVLFSPKPLQKPHPPIWVGGTSNGALRRVARYGDGWHPNRMSPETLQTSIETLKSYLDDAGRSLDDITLSVRAELNVSTSPSSNPEEPMAGTPDQIIQSIEAFRSISVEEFVFQVSSTNIDDINRNMEAFAEKVLPRLG
jgi:probable F420-dependent oxidoreductase